MKKINLLLLAGLTLGGIWCQAEEVVFDNRFIDDGKGGISGWLYNKTETAKPSDEIKTIMVNGQGGVSVTPKKSRIQLYTAEQIPAKTGDKFTFTAKVSGKGRYAFGLYQYGEKSQWQWLGLSAVWRRAASKKPVTIQVAVPVSKPGVKNICLALIVDADASVNISGLRCEKATEPATK